MTTAARSFAASAVAQHQHNHHHNDNNMEEKEEEQEEEITTTTTTTTTPSPPAPTTSMTTVFFPRWLRLAAIAPVEHRMECTNQVVEAISKRGGFLSQSNFLSDMATSLVLEDIEPQKLDHFFQALLEIDELHLHQDTVKLFQDCHEILVTASSSSTSSTSSTTAAQTTTNQQTSDHDDERKNDGGVVLPKTVAGVFQLTWRGSEGKLAQTIVADG